jgi:hypothetical protein
VFNFLYTYEGKHFCILPIGFLGFLVLISI